METINHFELSCGSIRLVPYTSEFDQQTVTWLNTPALRDAFGISRTVTLESHREWIKNQKDLLLWAIFDQDQAHVGNVSLQLNRRHASGYFQIYIGSSANHGKNLGTNALQCVLRCGFEDLNLHRIWLHLLRGNERAANLYKKFGFVEEGIERDGVFRNGRFFDQLRLSLLKEEWNWKAKK